MDFNYLIPILKIPALVGAIYFITGFLMFKFPPKKLKATFWNPVNYILYEKIRVYAIL
jgi:hypothetical protein